MKRLLEQQIELIDAWVAESVASDITPALLEKDIHVTDALIALMQIEHPTLSLVFCGGTSLSKAYGMIERMSEDIDLKVVPRDQNISRSALKRDLSNLKVHVTTVLSGIGLAEDVEARKALNENRYIGMQWFYSSAYESHGSLRPHLSIEFTTRTPRHPVETKEIGYLLDRLLEKPGSAEAACVIPAETLAEKVLSFLRRYAQYNAGEMEQPWDSALVRHIYDTYCIVHANHASLETAKLHFNELVVEDTVQFGKQFSEFSDRPKATLLQALADAESDSKLVDEYQRYLLPLIFGATRPSYEDAFAVFKECAKALLARVNSDG